MSEQRRIDLLFDATVGLLEAVRLIRRAAPVAGLMLVASVAVHGTLGGVEGASVLPFNAEAGSHTLVFGTVKHTPQALEEEADREATQEVSSTAQSRAVPALDREQMNIARFIASRYRLGVDATSEVVYHAYRAARDARIDPMLVLAVMSVESSFNPKAQSQAGAQGLMQVLTRVHADKFLPFGGLPAAFDPMANIRVGSAILKEYLNREGSVEGALKAYVGAALAEHDGGYGAKVLSARERIAAAAAGRPIPAEPSPPSAPREEPDVPMSIDTPIIEIRTPLPVHETRIGSVTERLSSIEPRDLSTLPVALGVPAARPGSDH